MYGTKKTHPSSSEGISFPWFHDFFSLTKKSRDNDFATFEGHFQTIFQDLGQGHVAMWPNLPI